MVHRNLTPSTILVKHDNSPILTSFEHARIPADVSVASPADGKDWDAVVSPEVRAQGRGAADLRSDILFALRVSRDLVRGRKDDVGVKASEVFVLGMDDNPAGRSSLSDLDAFLSDLLGEPVPGPPPPPARFWTEEQTVSFRGQSYRIVSRLGSGGVGTTFKVVEVDSEPTVISAPMSPRWLATKKWGSGCLAPISWRARTFAIRPCRRSSKLLPTGKTTASSP